MAKRKADERIDHPGAIVSMDGTDYVLEIYDLPGVNERHVDFHIIDADEDATVHRHVQPISE